MSLDAVLHLLHSGSQVLDKELPQVVQSLQLLGLRAQWNQNNFRVKLLSLQSCRFINHASLYTTRQPFAVLGLNVEINNLLK